MNDQLFHRTVRLILGVHPARPAAEVAAWYAGLPEYARIAADFCPPDTAVRVGRHYAFVVGYAPPAQCHQPIRPVLSFTDPVTGRYAGPRGAGGLFLYCMATRKPVPPEVPPERFGRAAPDDWPLRSPAGFTVAGVARDFWYRDFPGRAPRFRTEAAAARAVARLYRRYGTLVTAEDCDAADAEQREQAARDAAGFARAVAADRAAGGGGESRRRRGK